MHANERIYDFLQDYVFKGCSVTGQNSQWVYAKNVSALSI